MSFVFITTFDSCKHDSYLAWKSLIVTTLFAFDDKVKKKEREKGST